jgi:hypothetical protein
VGFDIALGMVHLRPELAFAVYPGIGQTLTSRVGEMTNSVSATGGFGFAVLPGFTITSIKDVTPIPHNGCRPPKRRRV